MHYLDKSPGPDSYQRDWNPTACKMARKPAMAGKPEAGAELLVIVGMFWG